MVRPKSNKKIVTISTLFTFGLIVVLVCIVPHPVLAASPKIAVGLTTVNEDWVTVSSDRNARLLLDDGTPVHDIAKEEHVIMRYDRASQKYIAQYGDWSITTEQPVRFKPKRNSGVVTVRSYENRPTWNQDLNDNTFYGEVRIQFSNPDNDVWLVNTLGIERYVQGIAEASNDNDPAYLKTLYTAARTYAYYHYLHPTKHAGQPFLLTNTPNDQVYRGKSFTDRSPNVVTAVHDTRGRIITYDGEVIVAAYFSRSDGRTRSWSEVWGGDKPYAQSKADPCCGGQTLLGHGVGLSAEGARYFAEEQDWNWKRILKYYYTGVHIPTIW